MSIEVLYQSLLESVSVNVSSESFELDKLVLLKEHVSNKYPSVKYVNIEKLDSDGEIVLNVSLFDSQGEQLGGAEITKTDIFWDDAV
jgi:hypothetical protein